MKISHDEFKKFAQKCFNNIPGEFKRRLDNIDIVVVDKPSPKFYKRKGIERLLGLYRGVPLRRRGVFYSNVLSDRIILYKENIESQCGTKQQLKEKIEDVLLHEIGHYFGLSEKELRNLNRE